jgi:hypothetical protein
MRGVSISFLASRRGLDEAGWEGEEEEEEEEEEGGGSTYDSEGVTSPWAACRKGSNVNPWCPT